MTLGQKIKQARLNKNMTQKELAVLIGAKHNSISNWEKDQNKPDADMLEALCTFLEISPNYLLNKDETSFDDRAKALQESPLPVNLVAVYKKDIFDKYLSLDTMAKETVDNVINFEYKQSQKRLKEREQEGEREQHNREIPLFDLPASAGTGTFLDSNYYELVSLEGTPPKATFAVRITGDSMEPRYKDGDIAFVKHQPTIESGEIGIFILNNEGFIKKLLCDDNNCFLVSLNPEYLPIQINENDEFRTVGKVLN